MKPTGARFVKTRQAVENINLTIASCSQTDCPWVDVSHCGGSLAHPQSSDHMLCRLDHSIWKQINGTFCVAHRVYLFALFIFLVTSGRLFISLYFRKLIAGSIATPLSKFSTRLRLSRLPLATLVLCKGLNADWWSKCFPSDIVIAGDRLLSVLFRSRISLLDTALLEWVSEDAVRAYITPDSVVSYLNYAQIT